jgi:hypothetical protein
MQNERPPPPDLGMEGSELPGQESPAAVQARRKPGRLKGAIQMTDDFDACDDEIADLFDSGPGPSDASSAADT